MTTASEPLKSSATLLGIACSPRRGGNSDLLLDQALEGAAQAGAQVERIVVPHLRIAPCIACQGCWSDGHCVIQDDYQLVYRKLVSADCLILATPVYFMGVSAQAKALIDRCQCFWALKYVLKEPPPPTLNGQTRRGALIATAGSDLSGGLDCARLTMRYFLDSLQAELVDALTINNVDEKGAILDRPEKLKRARALGKKLVNLPIDKNRRQIS